jgi:hypothetical protein
MAPAILVAWMLFKAAYYDDLREAPVVTCVAVAEQQPAEDQYPQEWCRGWA